MKGDVNRPTAKLFNYRFFLLAAFMRMAVELGLSWGNTQLLLPPMLTPFARMLSGKTSETTIQATGPAVVSIHL